MDVESGANGDPVKQRRHHFVQSYYLRAWCVGRRLAGMRHGGHVVRLLPGRAAVKQDFYRLEATDADIKFIKAVAQRTTDPGVRALHEQCFEEVAAIREGRRLVEFMKAHGLGVEPGLGREERVELEAAECNFEEQHHTRIEDCGIPCLDELRRGELAFFHDVRRRIDFKTYLAAQYQRTRKACLAFALNNQVPPDVSIERAWPVLNRILAFNWGFEFVARPAYRATLLEAAPGCEFITMDAPVLLLEKPPGEPADWLGFYYPLSPEFALTLKLQSEGGQEHARVSLDPRQVEHYNRQAYSQAHEWAFARNGATLESLRSGG